MFSTGRRGGKEGRREGGKEGRREGGKEGRREGGKDGRKKERRKEVGKGRPYPNEAE
jgi:hypothetical protein